MLRVLAIVIILVTIANPAQADEIVLEEGAIFDGGICWEADGTEGIAALDGSCVTPADYDELFSYEALTAVEVHGPDSRSVAEVYGITADSPAASVRVRVFMGVSEPTFAEYVTNAHQVVL